jgi:anion-transporting  ArsA/GET3 family ATPase
VTASLLSILRTARVIVTVGSGGVGKTTTAAVLGVSAAGLGRKVLVMTVDPARRLATALGLDELGHEIKRVQMPLDHEGSGEMWATMLDMKSTFDAIVDKYSDSPEIAAKIRENRFYQFFSTSLAGAQELSAGERLFEVWQEGQFDLIIIDTPPTSNAFDFLDAPVRFFEALDSAAIQWVLTISGRANSSQMVNFGTQILQRTLGKFTGDEFFAELGEFLFHFSGLLDGIKSRSQATGNIFRGTDTHFVVVTSPEPNSIHEAKQFRSRLTSSGIQIAAIVVNRVTTAFSLEQQGLTVSAIAGELPGFSKSPLSGPAAIRLGSKLLAVGEILDRFARRDLRVLADLTRSAGSFTRVIPVPLQAHDIHSVDALRDLGKLLLREEHQ